MSRVTAAPRAHAALAQRRESRGLVGRAFDTFGPYFVFVVALIAWEYAAQHQLVIPFLLPALSTVLERIANDVMSGSLAYNVGLTLYRTLFGFFLAASVGITIGIMMARVGSVRWFFDPLVSIGLPMPKLALMPVFMLWFGLFDASKILMVAFSALWQIVMTTWNGTKGVEKELIWSAQSLGANDRQVLREVILPAALPQILTGLQIALPVCLIVVLVTEMLMGGRGLGDAMLVSARYAQTPGVFAGIIEIGTLGFIVIKTGEYIRRRLLVWHQETQREETTV
jgi:ABC-type nitrate/sulfonate/bicarbonate transport system permease component